MRRLQRLPLEQLAPCLYESSSELGVLKWGQLFDNDHTVEIEVGFGKGLFLLNESQRRPEVNFFGIEIERKHQLYAATRLVKRGLTNVRLACADARQLLRDRIADASVQAFHVYFPDPWWKQRHRKRRLFNEEFVALVQRILQPGGKLHIATDVEEYFEVMTALLSEKNSLRPLPMPDLPQPAHDLDYLTNFDRKARKQGKPIYRANYEK